MKKYNTEKHQEFNEQKKIENLTKKINELIENLKEEKNKNLLLEKEVSNLKNKLYIIRKKFENLKIINRLDYELKTKLNKIDSKESLIKIILEKEKEVKEMKAKLLRFPFELNEKEKLMTIIFTSVDEKLLFSVIWKNTDKFNIIENKLYEEYPIYYESENYFTVNGSKINKAKSLVDNKIYNNDVILLNLLDI